jgi:S-adenosylmethionine synthetase
MLAKIKKDIVEILIPRIIKNPTHAHLFNDTIQYHINPTGKVIEDHTEILV